MQVPYVVQEYNIDWQGKSLNYYWINQYSPSNYEFESYPDIDSSINASQSVSLTIDVDGTEYYCSASNNPDNFTEFELSNDDAYITNIYYVEFDFENKKVYFEPGPATDVIPGDHVLTIKSLKTTKGIYNFN